MRVLYLASPRFLEPDLTEFRRCATAHEVTVHDPARPDAEQLEGVGVVVDHGGVPAPGMVEIAATAGVRLWQVISTGLNHVDLNRLWGAGLAVANTPGFLGAPAVAEHALLLLLACAKHLPESLANLEAGVFYQPLNRELRGRTLLVVGLGASGSELARMARALGMRVLATELEAVPSERAAELGVERVGGPADLDVLLPEADFVSLHVPLDPSTRHLIDARRLSLMGPGASLVNVARGGVVDEAALAEALRNRRLAAAGLDVFTTEPPPAGHPLLGLPNVFATPHVAGVTEETVRRRAEAAADNVDRVARGEAPLYVVSPA